MWRRQIRFNPTVWAITSLLLAVDISGKVDQESRGVKLEGYKSGCMIDISWTAWLDHGWMNRTEEGGDSHATSFRIIKHSNLVIKSGTLDK